MKDRIVARKRRIIVSGDEIDGVEVGSTTCCGIYEISNLTDNAWAVILKMAIDVERNFNMFIFTDAVKYKRGAKLAGLIRRHKLGSLATSKIVYNPNSANTVRMWTFYPDWTKIRKILNESETKDSDTSWGEDDYYLTV